MKTRKYLKTKKYLTVISVINISTISAALLAAAVMIGSTSDSHADGIKTEPPAAEPLILEGLFSGFSQDGQWAVTAARENQENRKYFCRIYDMATGKEAARVDGYVYLFSPDCKQAVVKSDEPSAEKNKPVARIYDTAAWKEIARFETEWRCLFSPDSQWAFATSIEDDQKFMHRLYNTATWKDPVTNVLLWDLQFSPDSKRAAAFNAEDSPLYDTATWKEIAKLEGKPFYFSPDSRWIETLKNGGRTIRIYDTAAGKETAKFEKVWTRAGNVSFSADSKWASVVFSEDNEITSRIYDTTAWKEAAKIEGVIQFLYRNSKLAAASDGIETRADLKNMKNVYRLYDTATWKKTAEIEGNPFYFSPDGKWAAAANERNPRFPRLDILIYDTAAWKEIAKFEGCRFSFSRDGKWALRTIERDVFLCTSLIYDTATWKAVAEYEGMGVRFYGQRAIIPEGMKTLITDIDQLHRFPTQKSVKEYIEQKQAGKQAEPK